MTAQLRAITYLRVSTARQGASGLGLEGQREAVTTFAAGRRIAILDEYLEVESGKKNDRPALTAALAHAKREGAILLIAKLDRLARSVALISSLMEAGVDFRAADMPDANKFLLHIFAAVAEYEREQISARTKSALTAAKARGVRLGVHSQVLATQRIAEARTFAETVRNPVGDIIRSGASSVRAVAIALNERGIPSREGGHWGPANTAGSCSGWGSASALERHVKKIADPR